MLTEGRLAHLHNDVSATAAAAAAAAADNDVILAAR